jgi:cobalt-zinc-cadmium efflux system protein
VSQPQAARVGPDPLQREDGGVTSDHEGPPRHDDGGHDHHHGGGPAGHSHVPNRTSALVVAIGANTLLLVVQVVVAVAVGSLALAADSLHNASDVVALVIALIGQVLVTRPPNTRRTYGYGRAEVLAALLNSAVLLAITGWVVVEAVGRLGDPHDVQAGPLFVVGVLGVAVNGLSAWYLSRSGSSLNIRAAFWHLAGDALGSFGVVVAAVAIAVWGAEWADPVASILISVLVLWAVVGVLRESIGVLLEAAPRGVDTEEVTRALESMPGVTGVHHVHLWSLDSETPALTAHLQIGHGSDLHAAQVLADAASAEVRERFGIVHTTFQTECDCVEAPVTFTARPEGDGEPQGH